MNRLRATKRRLADWDAVFRALAHESRRQILLILHFRGGRMTAGEIAGRFACSWPTTTRHLGVLEEAGLVRVRKAGRERIYELDRARLRTITGGWLGVFEGRPAQTRRSAKVSPSSSGGRSTDTTPRRPRTAGVSGRR